MNLPTLKKERPYLSKADKTLGIQTYGEFNTFPQDVLKVVNGSSTGRSCVNIYSKFLAGKGFTLPALNSLVINRNGDTLNRLHAQICDDVAQFNGAYIHVNYNANGYAVEYQRIPFEMVRLGLPGTDQVAVHPDWAKEFTRLHKWSKDDIKYLPIFTPNRDTVLAQIEAVGGIHNYDGQVFIYYAGVDGNYCVPIYYPALTDCSTEQGVSNLSYRNARNNFFPAGMLVDFITDEAQSDGQEKDIERTFMDFQGDTEAAKILYATARNKDEAPKFESFESKNYDKEFTVTDESCRGRIGRAFIQPPILRSEDVGAGFGADLVKNSYNFYNSVTEQVRDSVGNMFIYMLKFYVVPVDVTNAKIDPLTFNPETTVSERLGDTNTQRVLDIVKDTALSPATKKGILKTMYGLTDKEVNELIIA